MFSDFPLKVFKSTTRLPLAYGALASIALPLEKWAVLPLNPPHAAKLGHFKGQDVKSR